MRFPDEIAQIIAAHIESGQSSEIMDEIPYFQDIFQQYQQTIDQQWQSFLKGFSTP